MIKHQDFHTYLHLPLPIFEDFGEMVQTNAGGWASVLGEAVVHKTSEHRALANAILPA